MIPLFDSPVLEQIARLFGDTGSGFTGSEIARLLEECQMHDPGPLTKWDRIYQSFLFMQGRDRCGNHVGAFIMAAMKPVRHLGNPQRLSGWRDGLNAILAFSGMSIDEAGILHQTEQATTIDEALRRVNSLRKKLSDRNIHPEVYRYCTQELVAENYFHAVFEACKGVAERIREKTGLTDDGGDLVDQVFSIKNPRAAINTLQTESEQSEHKGFANLLKGVFGMIRNPLAHNPRANWIMSEQDALDTFSMLSLIHRKLDKMVVIPGRN